MMGSLGKEVPAFDCSPAVDLKGQGNDVRAAHTTEVMRLQQVPRELVPATQGAAMGRSEHKAGRDLPSTTICAMGNALLIAAPAV